MEHIESFPAIASRDARVLILGSMPGLRSLQSKQYYANPNNSFWTIIENLFCDQSTLTYTQRKHLLTENKIALWDVLKSCQRPGSLDSSIVASSIIVNDFSTFFSNNTDIKNVFFNGATAEKEFHRWVMPTLSPKQKKLSILRLPSTSPAMASMSKNEKLRQWEIVKKTLRRTDCKYYD